MKEGVLTNVVTIETMPTFQGISLRKKKIRKYSLVSQRLDIYIKILWPGC